MYIYKYRPVHIYIYIEREREKDKKMVKNYNIKLPRIFILSLLIVSSYL